MVNFEKESQRKACLAWVVSIEQYLCGRVTYTSSISTQSKVLAACGRGVGGDTKSPKIRKDPLKAAKHNFFESQGLFSPQLSTTTLRVLLTLINLSKNVI